jgi:FkbM family methyltransferase
MMRDDKLIFDVGMHIGQDTAFYLAKGFNVIAIEANPLLVVDAEKRFQQEIASCRLTILNVGVGAEEGMFPFYINAQHSEWSSFDREIGSRGGCKGVIEIPMLPFERLVERYGVPYYLKIDIEGYDFVVLQRLALTGPMPRYLSVENGWPFMLDHLVRLGYAGFKFINQAKVPMMQCPSPCGEGLDIPWTFPFSASGPFGEDTPGNWKSAQDIIVDIKAYWDHPALDPNVHGWYDLHAMHV